MKKSFIFIIILLILLLYVGQKNLSNKIATLQQPPPTPTRHPSDLLRASKFKRDGFIVDQELHIGVEGIKPGKKVVAETVIPPGGFLVVYRQTPEGELGQSIGSSKYLQGGINENVVIETREKLQVGDSFIVALHVDGDKDGKFTNAQADPFIVDPAGYVVLNEAVVGPLSPPKQ